ncbi:hypothetical protein ACSBR2_009989 [Camellia fascicularis]
MDFCTSTLYLLLALTSIRALFSFLRGTKKCPKLPPGPVPLPVIGNLLKLGDKPHQSLAELAKTHGPIMSLKLGRVTVVVISSSAMAKEVLQKQDLAFSNRSIPNALHAHEQYKYSVVWLPVSNRWRSLRKILNSNIFSGNRLDATQELRRRKVAELVEYAQKCSEEGVAMNIGRAGFRTSMNVLSNTIFSEDLADPREDTGKEFKELVWNIMVEAGKPNLVDFFPRVAKMDPQGIRRRMTDYFGSVLELFGGLIDRRLEVRRFRKSPEENDVIDILLNISEKTGDEIDRVHIERLCLDLFAAGTETTSSTLEWAMAELLRNPETLKNAKVELEQIVGKGKPISEYDIPHLPYLSAIVKETLRMHPAVPFLIPRKVDSEEQVCGYTIPKGTQVLVNAWAIGRDQSIWPKPDSFMPERFMDSKIDVRGCDFELIPFGAGRRICPGLPLAIRIIPMMLGSLINLFDWKLQGGIEPKDLDMKEKFGITLQKAQPLLAIPISG